MATANPEPSYSSPPGRTHCERCNREVPADSTVEIQPHEEHWCQECARETPQCSRCNRRVDPRSESLQSFLDRPGRSYCEECSREIDAFTCERCGEQFTGDYYGEEGICHQCAEDRDTPEEPIEEYHSHDRMWNRFGEPKKRIFYGVELEAISKTGYGFSEVAEDLVRSYGWYNGREFLFTEDDCSLEHQGFETIFHPMAPEWIRSHTQLLGRILKLMIDNGMISYLAPDHGVSAGMHVSVMFNRLRLWERHKFLALIFNNKALTAAVSRRRPEDLERWARIEAPATIPKMVMKKVYGAKEIAVNVKTVMDEAIGKYITLAEVRIFRGTLKFESFLMNLEYVIACVELAMDHHYGLRQTTQEDLLGYIRENRKQFPHIYAWLKEKGWVK